VQFCIQIFGPDFPLPLMRIRRCRAPCSPARGVDMNGIRDFQRSDLPA